MPNFVQWQFDPAFSDWWDLIHGIPPKSAVPDAPVINAWLDSSTLIKLNAKLNELKKNAWEGGGPTFDDLAAAVRGVLDGSDTTSAFALWDPSVKKLPYPLQYKLEKMAQSVIQASSEARKKSEAKLQPNQITLEDARSGTKSNVLLAMKAAEFAEQTKSSAEALKAEIQKMSVLLWGKVIEVTPPSDVTEDKLLGWYQTQVDELTANVTADPVTLPGEGAGAGAKVVPLVAQHKALVDKYETIKQEGEDKGIDANDTQPQLLLLLDQAEALRTQIQILIADTFGMLSDLIELVKGDGGVFAFLDFGTQFLGNLPALSLINIDGTDVEVPPTPEESKGAADAAAKFADFAKWGKETLGWAWGLIGSLKKFGDDIGLEFSDGTQDRIQEMQVLIQDEFPQTQESSSLLWLLLAAAAAASQKKG